MEDFSRRALVALVVAAATSVPVLGLGSPASAATGYDRCSTASNHTWDREAGGIDLAPPQIMSLIQLAGFGSVVSVAKLAVLVQTIPSRTCGAATVAMTIVTDCPDGSDGTNTVRLLPLPP